MDDIERVAAMARDIWRDHYVPIIGETQTDYMLDKFQSALAITGQISAGYRYYVALQDGTPVGYCAFVPDPADQRVLLSKLYVSRSRRGQGIGAAMVAFVENACTAMGKRELWLTVNRHNTGSIAFYRRIGFSVTGALVQDIGHGYVMDDFRMAKSLGVQDGHARAPAADERRASTVGRE